MAWKQRALWTLISMIAAYVTATLVSRRFQREISDLRHEMDQQNAMVKQMLIAVKNGLNAHG